MLVPSRALYLSEKPPLSYKKKTSAVNETVRANDLFLFKWQTTV